MLTHLVDGPFAIAVTGRPDNIMEESSASPCGVSVTQSRASCVYTIREKSAHKCQSFGLTVVSTARANLDKFVSAFLRYRVIKIPSTKVYNVHEAGSEEYK